MFCGICGVVSSGVGFVLGTNIFKTLWKFMNKDQARQLEEVCKDFLKNLFHRNRTKGIIAKYTGCPKKSFSV